jgi:hypothetical protein
LQSDQGRFANGIFKRWIVHFSIYKDKSGIGFKSSLSESLKRLCFESFSK